jgi:cold shock CspA family protein
MAVGRVKSFAGGFGYIDLGLGGHGGDDCIFRDYDLLEPIAAGDIVQFDVEQNEGGKWHARNVRLN